MRVLVAQCQGSPSVISNEGGFDAAPYNQGLDNAPSIDRTRKERIKPSLYIGVWRWWFAGSATRRVVTIPRTYTVYIEYVWMTWRRFGTPGFKVAARSNAAKDVGASKETFHFQRSRRSLRDLVCGSDAQVSLSYAPQQTIALTYTYSLQEPDKIRFSSVPSEASLALCLCRQRASDRLLRHLNKSHMHPLALAVTHRVPQAGAHKYISITKSWNTSTARSVPFTCSFAELGTTMYSYYHESSR